MSGESAHNIGEYQGFKLGIEKSVMSGMCTAVLQGNLKYVVDVELDNNIGNCIRIENLKKNGILAKVESLEQKIEATKADMKSATDALNKPFEHGDELKAKLARIEVVNHELSFDKPQEDTYVDEDILIDSKQNASVKLDEKQMKEDIQSILNELNDSQQAITKGR